MSWIQFGEGSGTLNGTQFVTGQAPVSHNNATIEFEDAFDAPPIFLAGIQSLFGGDTAAVRRVSVDGTQAVVFLEEETSFDAEIFHAAETVGFLAMDAGIIQAIAANDGKLGETGVVDLDSDWTQVDFTQPYENPVVIMGTASTIDEEGVTTRVRNVTSTGFEVRIQEWDYLDGNHAQESVAYLVMESGVHVLEDGTTIAAGVATGVTNLFKRIKFPVIFDSNPVVFSQVATDNDNSAVITRHGNVGTASFDFRIQEEQSGLVHGVESVSWIAIEQAVGVNNSLLFETGTTGTAVNHGNYNLNFAQTYTSVPAFFAQMQSFNGADPGTIRYRQLDLDGSQIFLQEEASVDAELGHGFENVGYMAFETGSIFSKYRAPFGRPAPGNNGNQPGLEVKVEQFDLRFTSVLPEASPYSLTHNEPANRQSYASDEAFQLTGSIELADTQADAAFSDLAESDFALDADFVDSLNEVLKTDA